MLTRRNTLIGCFVVGLAGCAGSNVATSLTQAKLYGDDLANALSAAGQEFMIATTSTLDQKVIVQKTLAAIQVAKTALDNAVARTDAIGIVNQIIAAANTLYPLVSPYLGAAGLYVPIALAVLQAFIDSLPPPSDAPPTPPAALHEKAMAFRRH